MFLQSFICSIVFTRNNIDFYTSFLKLSIALNKSQKIWGKCMDSSEFPFHSLHTHQWMHYSCFNLFPHKIRQILQKVLCSLFQKCEWWHVQSYGVHSLYLFHDLDELCHADIINQTQHSMKNREQLVNVICILSTGVLFLLKMVSWSLPNRAELVLWERKKITVCLVEAQNWQCIEESAEVLPILCGSARWKSWFDFNGVFCLNCSSVKYTERLIEAKKAFSTLEVSATPNSFCHHCAKQTLKERAAWITTVHQKSTNASFLPPQLIDLWSYQK